MCYNSCMVKTCRKCGIEKHVAEFGKRPQNIDGLNNQCKKCASDERRAYYAVNADVQKAQVKKYTKAKVEEIHEWLGEYLLSHPCVDCGNTDVLVLEFDHINDDKEDNVSRMIYRQLSLDKVKAEVSKCEVRCVNCHRKITNKRRRELNNG